MLHGAWRLGGYSICAHGTIIQPARVFFAVIVRLHDERIPWRRGCGTIKGYHRTALNCLHIHQATMNLLTAVVAVCALLALFFLFRAASALGRGRLLGAGLRLLFAVAFAALGGCAVLIGQNLASYQRLTQEQPAGHLTFKQTAPQQFDATLVYPDGRQQQFALGGDEWQLDARVLKWHALVNLIGFDSAFRLERVAGRYADVTRERNAPRSVYALAQDERLDLWSMARKYKQWLPWLDTYYGSATYMPMADGAAYEVSVSQSGLLARPLNEAARGAIGGWQ